MKKCYKLDLSKTIFWQENNSKTGITYSKDNYVKKNIDELNYLYLYVSKRNNIIETATGTIIGKTSKTGDIDITLPGIIIGNNAFEEIELTDLAKYLRVALSKELYPEYKKNLYAIIKLGPLCEIAKKKKESKKSRHLFRK